MSQRKNNVVEHGQGSAPNDRTSPAAQERSVHINEMRWQQPLFVEHKDPARRAAAEVKRQEEHKRYFNILSILDGDGGVGINTVKTSGFSPIPNPLSVHQFQFQAYMPAHSSAAIVGSTHVDQSVMKKKIKGKIGDDVIVQDYLYDQQGCRTGFLMATAGSISTDDAPPGQQSQHYAQKSEKWCQHLIDFFKNTPNFDVSDLPQMLITFVASLKSGMIQFDSDDSSHRCTMAFTIVRPQPDNPQQLEAIMLNVGNCSTVVIDGRTQQVTTCIAAREFITDLRGNTPISRHSSPVALQDLDTPDADAAAAKIQKAINIVRRDIKPDDLILQFSNHVLLNIPHTVQSHQDELIQYNDIEPQPEFLNQLMQEQSTAVTATGSTQPIPAFKFVNTLATIAAKNSADAQKKRNESRSNIAIAIMRAPDLKIERMRAKFLAQVERDSTAVGNNYFLLGFLNNFKVDLLVNYQPQIFDRRVASDFLNNKYNVGAQLTGWLKDKVAIYNTLGVFFIFLLLGFVAYLASIPLTAKKSLGILPDILPAAALFWGIIAVAAVVAIVTTVIALLAMLKAYSYNQEYQAVAQWLSEHPVTDEDYYHSIHPTLESSGLEASVAEGQEKSETISHSNSVVTKGLLTLTPAPQNNPTDNHNADPTAEFDQLSNLSLDLDSPSIDYPF